ncbi:urea ABC transporter permease subunit UrtB [Panacagrimonas sp.]|uniref:urea ABC transporter permease subunit UrtB n=1 Tax=Panacagrimonas sp. TaxID=2480088 RepID=UPI003B51D33D
MFGPVPAPAQPPPPADLAQTLAPLANANFRQKQDIAVAVAQSAEPGARATLAAFLDGELYAREADGAVLIGKPDGDALALTDPVSLKSLTTVPAEGYKKIGTNNSLRKLLRGLVAQIDLNDEDADVRRAAIRESLRNLDADTVAAFRARLQVETSARVKRALQVGLAMDDLGSADVERRLAAVRTLEGEYAAEVHNRLRTLVERDSSGAYAEPDVRVRDAAREALAQIDSRRQLYGMAETLFFGLSLGSVLVLAAIGLAITFGVMGVINMAHGELIMLGAYTAYVMQLLMPDHLGWSLILSVPAAFVVSGLFGVAIERGIVRHLYGRPLETLLATFGLSLILQQLVRSVFSPNNRPVAIPDFMSGVWQINELFALTYNRLYILLFSLIVFAGLLMVLKRTPLGLQVRAVSQNRAMARAMGVRSSFVDAATFGLGAGIAGIAGVALSQLTNVGPNLGQAYIIDSFMVVVFGGVGNLWGTLIGGMSLGVINKLLEPYAGAVLAKILVLVALILFIQRKPRGLFPQKGRAAEGL